MNNNKYVIVEGKANNWEEAIKICGTALYEAGLVAESFAEKCRIREVEYPTGLPTKIPVAIPHCKDEGIKENSICLLKLEQPVEFFRMDDDQKSVMTDMIFNLAIKDAEGHLEALQKLMLFVNDVDKLKKCRMMQGDALVHYLEEHIG